MRASAVNANNAYNRTETDDEQAPKKSKASERAGNDQAAANDKKASSNDGQQADKGTATEANKPAAEAKQEDVAKSIEDAKSRVEQKGAQYEQRAEGKAVVQKWGDDVRQKIWGDRDDQFKNIRTTKEALNDIQQQQQSGKLSDTDAAAKVKETEGKFEQEFKRVSEAQQTNSKVGQVVNVAGREVSSTSTGLAAAGATTAGTAGAGTVAAPVVGVSTKIATASAWDAVSKVFFEGKADSGFTGQNSTSAGNLAVRWAQGEKITGSDVASAATQAALDGVGGGSALKSAKTLSVMKDGGELTGKFVPDAINFGIKNAPTAVKQTVASNALESGKIATDSKLTDEQKADGIVKNTLKAPSQAASNIIGGGVNAGQLSNPVANATTQFGANTATDLGRTVFENSVIDKKQTDVVDIFSSAVNGATSTLPSGKRAGDNSTVGGDNTNNAGATQRSTPRSDSEPTRPVDAQTNSAGGGGDEPPKGAKRTSGSPDEPDQPADADSSTTNQRLLPEATSPIKISRQEDLTAAVKDKVVEDLSAAKTPAERADVLTRWSQQPIERVGVATAATDGRIANGIWQAVDQVDGGHGHGHARHADPLSGGLSDVQQLGRVSKDGVGAADRTQAKAAKDAEIQAYNDVIDDASALKKQGRSPEARLAFNQLQNDIKSLRDERDARQEPGRDLAEEDVSVPQGPAGSRDSGTLITGNIANTLTAGYFDSPVDAVKALPAAYQEAMNQVSANPGAASIDVVVTLPNSYTQTRYDFDQTIGGGVKQNGVAQTDVTVSFTVGSDGVPRMSTVVPGEMPANAAPRGRVQAQ